MTPKELTLDVPAVPDGSADELRAHAERLAAAVAAHLADQGAITAWRRGGFAVVIPSGWDRPSQAEVGLSVLTARTGERVGLRLVIRPRVPESVAFHVTRPGAGELSRGMPRRSRLFGRLVAAVRDAERLAAEDVDLVA